MKNKIQLIFGILLSIISLIFIFIGAATNITMLIISIICFSIGIAVIMRWSTVSYKWVCDECGESFDITLKQNVFGMNCGINYKNLYCPKCHKKTMCKGIKQ